MPANTFIVSDWIRREAEQRLHDWEAERRVSELRNSLAFAERVVDDKRLIVGDTIRVRVPKRYS